jgi:hypothetical protein
MFCPQCDEATDKDDICRACGNCEDCCDCLGETFDSDEFGEEPEDEYERRTRGQFIR